MKESENLEIRTLVGIFLNNEITTEDGEAHNCITYNMVKQQIQGKFGCFNLRYSPNIDEWVVFQYALF